MCATTPWGHPQAGPCSQSSALRCTLRHSGSGTGGGRRSATGTGIGGGIGWRFRATMIAGRCGGSATAVAHEVRPGGG